MYTYATVRDFANTDDLIRNCILCNLMPMLAILRYMFLILETYTYLEDSFPIVNVPTEPITLNFRDSTLDNIS